MGRFMAKSPRICASPISAVGSILGRFHTLHKGAHCGLQPSSFPHAIICVIEDLALADSAKPYPTFLYDGAHRSTCRVATHRDAPQGAGLSVTNIGETSQQSRSAPLLDLLVAFLKVGVTSFGGGTSAWMHREVVSRRGWLSEEAFLTSLTIAQVLPGANPVNLSVYIGLQLRGAAGAVAAVVGMVAPAFCVILAIAAIYSRVSGYPASHAVLGGLACVGIAATLVMGVKAARRLKWKPVPVVIALATFAAIGVFHWPMVPVVIVAVPVSVLAAYRFPGRDHA
jgi:chromate transporter